MVLTDFLAWVGEQTGNGLKNAGATPILDLFNLLYNFADITIKFLRFIIDLMLYAVLNITWIPVIIECLICALCLGTYNRKLGVFEMFKLYFSIHFWIFNAVFYVISYVATLIYTLIKSFIPT